jgi:nucleoside 2-deoxyribosyltransferase
MELTVYWAAPLFTQAERVWNRRCAEGLRVKGYTVILPQDEARPFITPEGTNFDGIAEQCYRCSIECDVMIVVLDGADTDSGVSLEAGLKIGTRRALNTGGKVIGLRTDFRTSEDGQLNAMFRLLDHVVHISSFNEDVDLIGEAIHKTILQLCSGSEARI